VIYPCAVVVARTTLAGSPYDLAELQFLQTYGRCSCKLTRVGADDLIDRNRQRLLTRSLGQLAA
jgi:hypothetical protein